MLGVENLILRSMFKLSGYQELSSQSPWIKRGRFENREIYCIISRVGQRLFGAQYSVELTTHSVFTAKN